MQQGSKILLGGDNVSPLVEIGLTDLLKTGGAKAPPAPPLATALLYCNYLKLSSSILKFKKVREIGGAY